MNFIFVGYYRVNYDINTWSAIANILHKSHSIIDVINRAQVNDATSTIHVIHVLN